MSTGPTSTEPGRRTRFGGWLTHPSPIITEVFARSGMEWVVVDLQHGSFDFGSAIQSIQLLNLLGVESFVRLHADEIATLPRLLDHGLDGAFIAMVDGPETIARCVANARFMPDGMRSHPGGRRFGFQPLPASARDTKPLIYAIIETESAADTMAEIASVPGVAGLMLGPGDLSLSLGLELIAPPYLTDTYIGKPFARWHEIMDSVVGIAEAHGIEACAVTTNGTEAARWAAAGFHRVTIGADLAILRGFLAAELARARGVAVAPVAAVAASAVP